MHSKYIHYRGQISPFDFKPTFTWVASVIINNLKVSAAAAKYGPKDLHHIILPRLGSSEKRDTIIPLGSSRMKYHKTEWHTNPLLPFLKRTFDSLTNSTMRK